MKTWNKLLKFFGLENAKGLAWLALAIVATFPSCLHAQTLTPNIQLQVPAFNQSNWQVPLNYDLNRLDLLLSGNLPLPAINPTTFQFAPTVYSSLPACSPTTNGLTAAISDGTTNVWGASVGGGGGYYTWVYCQGYGAGAGYYVQPFAGGSFNFLNNPMTTTGDMIYEFSNLPTRLPIGSNGTCLVSNGIVPIWSSCAGTASTIWSSLTNPISNLVLDMGTGYSTEMDYANSTFAAALSFVNTTPATISTNNSSPALQFAANYYNAGSHGDTWAIDSTIAAGTNGNSYLQMYAIGGTGGLHIVSVPNLTIGGLTQYGVVYAGASLAPIANAAPGSAGQFLISGGSGAPPAMGYPTIYQTATNCINSASPAVCGSSAAGQVAIPPSATTIQVNTTSVGINSEIMVEENTANGFNLGVTCDTTPGRTYTVTSRTIATDFIVTASAAPTNSACLTYFIVNY